MKNADDSKPSKESLPEDSELGPEPDWLLDEDVQDEPVDPPPNFPSETAKDSEPVDPEEVKRDPSEPAPEEAQAGPSDPDPEEIQAGQSEPDPEEIQAGPSEPAPPPPAPEEISETTEFVADPAPLSPEVPEDTEVTGGEKKEHPWLWGSIPFVLLLATGLVAWFGTTQTLNDLATWDAIRAQFPPLLPARWAMTIWWLVLPLMMVFLIYGSLPIGREVTRIKVTGPLASIALGATALWIFAQHWQWEVLGIVSMGIATLSMLATYLLVALGPNIQNLRQRMIAMIPLSAALGYSVMLTVLSWQSYSSQPFGERGSSVLFALLVVVIAAVFAFFLRDGLFSLVLAIWFAGVTHQQWGDDAVISLVAAIALLFTGALAVLGTILATESHRPSLTTSVENRRGRTSFFNKSKKSTGE